ncbi:unnamed protein product [Lepeophtheirus salmonis]|uniref:(salmon louse) hypothetical protein n=1 Tax=Lepeophtheirus salmonis TaxID=72036 RepID=A0A817FDL9_LEPSM|nr:unnamed protein product [Lepeophtheirus salmonis]CAG9477406.1 unnamed protein product [Lepeophtheirus salmonis]
MMIDRYHMTVKMETEECEDVQLHFGISYVLTLRSLFPASTPDLIQLRQETPLCNALLMTRSGNYMEARVRLRLALQSLMRDDECISDTFRDKEEHWQNKKERTRHKGCFIKCTIRGTTTIFPLFILWDRFICHEVPLERHSLISLGQGEL